MITRQPNYFQLLAGVPQIALNVFNNIPASFVVKKAFIDASKAGALGWEVGVRLAAL
jgi:hypothetical protein